MLVDIFKTNFYDEVKKAIPFGTEAMQKMMVDYDKLFGRLQELSGRALSWDEKLERKYLTQAISPFVSAISAIPTKALAYGDLFSMLPYRSAMTQSTLADIDYKQGLTEYYSALKKSVLSELDPESPLNKAMVRLFDAIEKSLGQKQQQQQIQQQQTQQQQQQKEKRQTEGKKSIVDIWMERALPEKKGGWT